MKKKIPRKKMGHSGRYKSANAKKDSRNGESPVRIYRELHRQKTEMKGERRIG